MLIQQYNTARNANPIDTTALRRAEDALWNHNFRLNDNLQPLYPLMRVLPDAVKTKLNKEVEKMVKMVTDYKAHSENTVPNNTKSAVIAAQINDKALERHIIINTSRLDSYGNIKAKVVAFTQATQKWNMQGQKANRHNTMEVNTLTVSKGKKGTKSNKNSKGNKSGKGNKGKSKGKGKKQQK